MAQQIKTTGQLRQFLADALLSVKAGEMDADTARNLTKIASQINESIYSEIKASRMMQELQQVSPSMGQLAIGDQ